jgi:hypothetical protein
MQLGKEIRIASIVLFILWFKEGPQLYKKPLTRSCKRRYSEYGEQNYESNFTAMTGIVPVMIERKYTGYDRSCTARNCTWYDSASTDLAIVTATGTQHNCHPRKLKWNIKYFTIIVLFSKKTICIMSGYDRCLLVHIPTPGAWDQIYSDEAMKQWSNKR